MKTLDCKHRTRQLMRSLTLALVLACVLSAAAAETDTSYTLIAPINSTIVSLMDDSGAVVHSWETGYRPGLAAYFLEDGLLLHTGNLGNTAFTSAAGPQQSKQTANSRSGGSRSPGGAGGIVQLIDWDGIVTWEYDYSDDTHLQHHDVEMLPNGNVLLIAWEMKPLQEALAAGRDPNLLSDGELWPDSIIEVKPTGSSGGEIVWAWHVWDHLVQDFDASKPNYGVVADHPGLINLNYTMNAGADWTHINSVDYNAELDQILLSVHNFGEIWIIDHSTTTEEAAGPAGNLLYRWGNPQVYDSGSASDQLLFGQHDAEWITEGLPGAGDILLFNNGAGRPDGRYSTVDEITPPLHPDGGYGTVFDPDILTWRYTAEPATDFFAQNISGAQRLADGNTLICNGPGGVFFEVTPDGDTVWERTRDGSYFKIERYCSDYSGSFGTALY